MASRILVVLALLVACTLTVSAPAAASHPCIDDGMCPPHDDPPHPKELIISVWDRVQCLVVAQPPTACV